MIKILVGFFFYSIYVTFVPEIGDIHIHIYTFEFIITQICAKVKEDLKVIEKYQLSYTYMIQNLMTVIGPEYTHLSGSSSNSFAYSSQLVFLDNS